jgi:2'-5' RNA ligase
MGDKVRLFVAVNLSMATTRKLADAAARMRGAADQKGLRVTWVPPSNLHITLKFLGWTKAPVIDAVSDRLNEVTRGRKGFEVVARGTGGFPTDGHARVLWFGVEPSQALKDLAAAVEGEMARLGFAKEDRAFSPHVTFGRVKEGSGTAEVLAPFKQTDFGSSLIRDVVLYESIMKSSGSEYIARARAPLDVAPWRAERQTRDVEEGSKEEEPDADGTGQQST